MKSVISMPRDTRQMPPAKEQDYQIWSKEELVREIERLRKRKKYGLVWEDKPEGVVEQCKKELPVLEELKEKEIITDPTKPMNLFIEGDNYHALSVLNYTHKGKIDVIYIDPPYNTENKDFKYNDCWVDKNDAYRHSKWVSFMNRRLRLAKSLLKDDGAVFISINEEELAQLKLLCDEVFGEANYLTTFTIKVRHEDRILKGDKDFHEVVEYLLLYRRTEAFKPLKRKRDNTSIDDYVYEIKELSKHHKMRLGNKSVDVFKPGEYAMVKGDPGETKLKKISIRGSIKEGNSSGRFYVKFIAPVFNNKNGCLIKVPDMGGDQFNHRYFLTPVSKNRRNGDYFQGVPVAREDVIEFPFPNFCDFEEDFNNVGYEGGVDFRNGKKPVIFIQKMLEIANCLSKPKAIILDYFAGSGSTAHAVLDYNRQCGGVRQFIICTNNEVDEKAEKLLGTKGTKRGNAEYEKEGIARKICYPRIKNVIYGYSDPRGHKHARLGGNLKYFRTAFVSAEPTDRNKEKLTKKATDMLCIRENTFERVKDTDLFKIFRNQTHYTGIVFDQLAIPEFKRAIAKIAGKFSVYIFSLSDDTFDEEFEDLKGKVTLSPIPEAIVRVYRRIFK